MSKRCLHLAIEPRQQPLHDSGFQWHPKGFQLQYSDSRSGQSKWLLIEDFLPIRFHYTSVAKNTLSLPKQKRDLLQMEGFVQGSSLWKVVFRLQNC